MILFASPRTVIIALRRKRRFRLDVFLVRMWLLKARLRFTSPLPVILKRFLAPLWDFIFGMFPFLVARHYLGATIIVMSFPSSLPAVSTFPTSASSLATRSNTA